MPELKIPYYAVGEVVVSETDDGRLLTPMEASTGTPLPLLVGSEESEAWRWDKHHANFENESFMNGTPGTRAVCFSRLQHTPVWLHRRFHERFAGTPLPDGVEAEKRQTILGLAGYVPRFGIELGIHTTAIVPLSEDERRRLCQPDVFHIEKKRKSQAEIGQFLMDCAIWEDYDSVADKVEEFVSIKPRMARRSPELARRWYKLGMNLLNEGMERSAEPVEGYFRTARAERAMKESLLGKKICAWLVARRHVANYAADYLRTLEFRLRLEQHRALQTEVNRVELPSY